MNLEGTNIIAKMKMKEKMRRGVGAFFFPSDLAEDATRNPNLVKLRRVFETRNAYLLSNSV